MHQAVVHTRNRFDQLFASSGSGFLQILRDLDGLIFGALALVIPDQSLHRDEIDDTFELIFETNRNLQGYGVCTQASDDRVKRAIERCAGTIQLVYETNSRDAILVRLTPHSL